MSEQKKREEKDDIEGSVTIEDDLLDEDYDIEEDLDGSSTKRDGEEDEGDVLDDVDSLDKDVESDDDDDDDDEINQDEESQNKSGSFLGSFISDAEKTMNKVAENVKRDSNLPITRQEAIELLMNFPQETSDKNHYLESEAIMRALAKKFGESEEYWGMLGLLHDVDWHETKDDIERHTLRAGEILREKGFDDKFVSYVQSHAYGYSDIPTLTEKVRRERIEFALASAEMLTGLIYACAVIRDGNISDLRVKDLKKKFHDESFAEGCDRSIILEITDDDLDLDEYFELAIEAIKDIRDIIGLE